MYVLYCGSHILCSIYGLYTGYVIFYLFILFNLLFSCITVTIGVCMTVRSDSKAVANLSRNLFLIFNFRGVNTLQTLGVLPLSFLTLSASFHFPFLHTLAFNAARWAGGAL